MSVLRRNMFNRGGFVHRGTGITSGLAPIKGYRTGGISKREAYAPAWQSLFGGMMSGKSLQGGWGGAFDILGQSVQQSAPLFAQAAQTYAEGQQDTDRETVTDVNGFLRYKDTGEFVFPGTIKKELKTLSPGKALTTVTTTQEGEVEAKVELREERITPTKKNYVVGPNSILVNDEGNIIARGEPGKSNTLRALNPGQKLYNSDGEMIAHYDDPNAQIIKLNPGQRAYDKDGNLLFTAPANAKNQQIIKLSPGQTAYDIDGNEIVSKPITDEDEIIKLNPGQTAYDKDGNILFAAPDRADKEHIVKLNPGQVAFQMIDGELVELTSVPLKAANRLVTVAPGTVLYDKDTGEVVFENESTKPVQRLSTLSPGQSLIDKDGNVVYTAPSKDQYFKLSPGQSVYGIDGELLIQAPSMDDDQSNYGYKELTENEMAFKKIKNYESQMALKENGEFDTSDLTASQRQDYFRLLQTYDPMSKQELKTWGEFKKNLYTDLAPNIEFQENLQMARALFEANPATGPFRGRIAPFFNFLEDMTGVKFTSMLNDIFTEDRDFLMLPETQQEMDRIKKALAVYAQEFMKGQVNTFEQQIILGSIFDVTRSRAANELAFENLEYLADLKKAMIEISGMVTNEADFYFELEKWKKRNRPALIKAGLNAMTGDTGALEDISEEYGIPLEDLQLK